MQSGVARNPSLRRKSISAGAIMPRAGPFIKWAGGKTQLLPELGRYVPTSFERYFEPFLGGGALFFNLSLNRRFSAFLSDANEELVVTYKTVQSNVEELIEVLAKYEMSYKRDPFSFYYRLRDKTKIKSDLERAARFIALNKTCYNGLYRVNSRGIFNVPMGRYRNPTICDAEALQNASGALNFSKAKIVAADYREILQSARQGDFIYLDPPFDPLSATAHFVEYTKSGFGCSEQFDLANTFKELDRKNCRVLLSNSDTGQIRELYSEFSQRTTPVRALRAISCKASTRKGYTELLIRNYED